MKNTALLIILFVFISCNKKNVYQKFFDIPENIWHTDSLINFKLTQLDTNRNYKVFLNIRHGVEYKYQNIFLFSKTDYNKDTLEIYLCDNVGKWYGRGWGDIKDVSIDISNINNKKIINSKNISFEQAMRYGDKVRVNNLQHIHSLGIIIQQYND
jgi:gliding motility-associated lipoprotein GldH